MDKWAFVLISFGDYSLDNVASFPYSTHREGLSSQDHLDKVSPPWKGNFYQLISLWEIMQTLQPCAHDWANFLSKLVVFINHFEGSEIPLDDPIRELTSGWLRSVVPQAKELGLNISVIGIHRAQRAIKHDPASKVATALEDVCSRIIDELKNVMFLHIDARHVDYYNERQLFGKEVADMFPKAVTDIQEAGKCFALHRYTACIFHLMRVMERGVQELAHKLGVSPTFTYNEEWQKIINAIRGQLNNAYPKHNNPDRIKYEGIIGHLETVKIAWRNPTMHPKATYTEEEAKALLNAVEIFMKDLAEIL